MQNVVLGRGFVTAPLLSSAKYAFQIDPYSIVSHSGDQRYGQKRRSFKEAQLFRTSGINTCNKELLPLMEKQLFWTAVLGSLHSTENMINNNGVQDISILSCVHLTYIFLYFINLFYSYFCKSDISN
jgi:hypothetical protein